jgi:MoaA/NifB/PqqE/SkfB family radical SAM enzyme
MMRILSQNFSKTLPYKLIFATTYKCNSRCKICNIWKKYSQNQNSIERELKLNEIETFFKKSKFFSWITFTGGEPFLRKDLSEIIFSAYENCKNLSIINIPTNGLNTTKISKVINKILEETYISLVILSISVLGPRKIHDNITGKKGGWKIMINTFNKLHSLEANNANFKLIFEFTLSKFNSGCLEKTFNELKNHGVGWKDIYLNLYHTSKHYYGISSNFSSKDKKDIYILFKNRGFSLNPLNSLSYVYLKNALIKKPRMSECAALKSSCFINPYGDVYPCTILDRNLGNIKENNYNLKKILLSKKTKKARNEIKKNNCSKCWTPCEAYQTILSKFPLSII